jgi:hypothetical protein
MVTRAIAMPFYVKTSKGITGRQIHPFTSEKRPDSFNCMKKILAPWKKN